MQEISKIAVLLTSFNRRETTVRCLNTLFASYEKYRNLIEIHVFLTDDCSSDGTTETVKSLFAPKDVTVLSGTGSLFWNGGMIVSWKAALQEGGYDGYLWLNDDVEVLSNIWDEIIGTDIYSFKRYGKRSIYVGSTMDKAQTHLTYGGFNFVNRWTLKDKFVIPNGKFQLCECAHGNVTYVSQQVVEKMDIFTDKYIHSGGDHDYTYRAHKTGFPLIVMPYCVGLCDNDHNEDNHPLIMTLNLKERLKYLKSPMGFNLHNTLLFQKRCFPYRYPFVWITGYLKALFPHGYFKLYKWMRSGK